ncbi:MAG: helix-turn-helix domain-containing protein [Methylococcaceae bacterium]
MSVFALLAIGFSLGTSLLLIIAHSFQNQNQENYNYYTKAAGFFLLIFIAAIQSIHLMVLLIQYDTVHSIIYRLLLYSVAPSFYFYSRQFLIMPNPYHWHDSLHALPLLFCTFIADKFALSLAFLIGSFYLLWLSNCIYKLRQQRKRFKLELLALAVLFSIAIIILLLGFSITLLKEINFIISYSILIALTLFTTTLSLLRFPSVSADIFEAVQATYAESTLKNIDKTAVLIKLEQLMQKDKLYTLETLNLALLAKQLDLNAHQLSELINTEFQQGFSRYIRWQRIEAAKTLLLTEPNSSILAISLAVGFSSQSNFYVAFHDSVGMTPGQYRKLNK